MKNFVTNDIVIVETEDARGYVVAPAIIRYYNATNDTYELNVLFPVGEKCARGSDIGWWVVSPHEIRGKVGHARIDPK